MKTISLNGHALIYLWGLLPALLLGWLLFSYYRHFFPAVKASELALNEVPKDLPNFTPFKSQGKGAVTVWFNNGWKSQLNKGLPQLEKNQLKAAVSVVTSYTDYPGYLNWDEVKELQNKGWEIVAQGETYRCDWDDLNVEQLREEVYGAKRKLLAHGISSEQFASPCGAVDAKLANVVTYYYSSQKIGEEGNNNLPLENVYTIKGRTVTSKTTLAEVENWLSQAKASNQWVILTFNQISELDDNFSISPQKFNQVIEVVAKAGMETVVPSQVVAYNKAEGSL